MDEHWKTIASFPDYEVSDQGRIRRIAASLSKNARTSAGRVLKPSPNGRGRLHVTLVKSQGTKCTQQIAPLVMQAFGFPPDSLKRPQIWFSDGDPTNCSIENLCWIERYTAILREKLPMTEARAAKLKATKRRCNQAHYQRNIERIRATRRELSRERYRENPVPAKERAKRYVQRHPDLVRIRQRKYHAKNKEELNAKQQQRVKTDDHFRLKLRMGTQVISKRLQRRATGKGGNRTFALLGYTVDDLVRHLESQFVDGMSWANYGKWHVDHKIPDSRFSYSLPTDEGFRQSWALDNLQPLWALDNMRKSDRMDWVPTPPEKPELSMQSLFDQQELTFF